MTYVKRLVMKGFKSFARETTIEFDRHMNVIVGPNGSGKSNITDALCFVLGRLSIKSIRAAKAAHLIFSGNQQYKAGTQAVVEIIFDNVDKAFALDDKEISIKRIVNKNGQGTYKINNKTKTRQEVLELLGQAGIDPHGFNIVLQGEIMRFVKMQAEERRKVIEEVAGISVYEMRKEKSLKELEKTEDRLKQVNAVLRERTHYLKNLEQEREQALRFNKLQETVKRCKFSIVKRNLQDQEKILQVVEKKIEEKTKEISKKEQAITKTKTTIAELNQKAEAINKTVQETSGLEQETLLQEISELRQESAGLTARKENYENQLVELTRRRASLEETLTTTQQEIEEMAKEKKFDKKKELTEKKKKLESLDQEKRKYYQLRSQLTALTDQREDKKREQQRIENESHVIMKQMESTEKEINIKETIEQHDAAIIRLKEETTEYKEKRKSLQEMLEKKQQDVAVNAHKIKEAKEVSEDITKLDTCPLCKTKITDEHKGHVQEKAEKDRKTAYTLIEKAETLMKKIKKDREDLDEKSIKNEQEMRERELDRIKIQMLSEKKQQLARNTEQVKRISEEYKKLTTKRRELEEKLAQTKTSEEQYESLQLEVNELARREERNLGAELTARQHEVERINISLKQNKRDKEDIEQEVIDITDTLEEKESLIDEKEEQANELREKYQKLFAQKNALQATAREHESKLLQEQNTKQFSEHERNTIQIERAQVAAKKETLMEELQEFPNTEFINLPLEKLKERLHQSEILIARIGNVNLRALEVYEDVKREYEKVQEKVESLEKEKEEIHKIIAQIDRKKKKTFVQTLDELNELFSRNFSQLSTKGIAALTVQDKKEVFNAGIEVSINVGKGKYFDVTSLSGGEQTIVALSLIFAIQDLKPYSFYIFDEIDAALDRRNSEKLAYLLKKHMKSGQYILITHNDSIISESSSILYGVSMQEGVSKVLSLEV